MLTLGAFLLAIALLVAVHEWGHFAMARACGVKVLRFSIGIGPRVLGWTSQRSGTEYRLGLLPLGGFVAMLDEREAAVDPAELAQAFNRQRLRSRALIVAAGPLANLLLAILLYSAVNWWGVEAPEARIARPPQGSLAAQAGWVGGELVLRASDEQGQDYPVPSFDELNWQIARAALAEKNLVLTYQPADSTEERQSLLKFTDLDVRQADATLFRKIGFVAPFSPAYIGDLRPEGAAQAAGLQSGDVVRQVDGVAMADGAQLRELIRQSGSAHDPLPQQWLVERQGRLLELRVTPHRERDGTAEIGRVGAMIGATPRMVLVRLGLLQSVQRALTKTWEVSVLSLRMMGQIATGMSSYKNLSGPITIADYAGRSAAMGLSQVLSFLAIVSIRLGVLNLLPVPVLDGGHLMYYLWEGVTGRSISPAWMAKLQRVGVAMLFVMMSVAIFNDISRFLS